MRKVELAPTIIVGASATFDVFAVSGDHTCGANQRLSGDVNAPASERGFDYQKAPYVFQFGDKYWMLTDPHKGLTVYRSDDAVT